MRRPDMDLTAWLYFDCIACGASVAKGLAATHQTFHDTVTIAAFTALGKTEIPQYREAEDRLNSKETQAAVQKERDRAERYARGDFS